MNLRTIDLNLLVILDALLDEAHVSRAADRLGLSQPATSAALERCRHLFADPLLERGKAGMRATPKAEALRAPIKSLLADIQGLVNPPETDLATLRQTIRIIMADHPAAMIVGPLHHRLSKTAPGLDLVIQPGTARPPPWTG
ncbi:LysR family transcriptional regulator [Elstera litoralis]|uniref:LysR family transcriptional regulator n=1 Tax=Elstera litoralis TaxID=552518 RepID=UPI0018DB40BE|nr:LysR family transcriptional regulator [Elstera litoralis]